jgi:signal transduction histidine kinase
VVSAPKSGARRLKRKAESTKAVKKARGSKRAKPRTNHDRTQELEDEVEDLKNELERSERRLEAMKIVQQTLASDLDPSKLLKKLIERTTDLLLADRTTLFLIDPNTGDLVSTVIQSNEMKQLTISKGSGLAGWVAKNGRPVHIRDAYNDKRFDASVDLRSGYRTRCMLVWPVRHPRTDQVMGVVQVLNKLDGGFDHHDERLLDSIATSLGVAMEVMLLYHDAVERGEALERSRAKLELLYETEMTISQDLDLDEMLHTILDTALGSLHARSAVLYIVDREREQITVSAASGTNQNALSRLALGFQDPVLSRVLNSGEPCFYRDVAQDVFQRGRIKLSRLLAVPVRNRQGEILGVLELLNRKVKREFGEDAVRVLTVVAGQAGRAIYARSKREERERATRLASMGQMLSGVVHDIRTPMTLITGYSQLMARNADQSERDDFARKIKKQVDVMNSMTKELLGFAKGEHTILVRKVYVGRFMDQMREHLSQEMKGSGVSLTVTARYKSSARFDEVKMRRVFHNMARNACEAMPGGGKFKVSVSKRGAKLRFTFQDDGPGIPPEMRHRLFQAFATAGKIGGTGLGLAMVKRIADDHGGQISCESSAKKGTKFVLSIPALD